MKEFFKVVILTLSLILVGYNVEAKKNKKNDSGNVYSIETQFEKMLEFKIQIRPKVIIFDYFEQPDSDGDGLPDKYDNCPGVYGVASRMGCPEIDISKLITYACPYISISDEAFTESVKALNNISYNNNGELTEETKGNLMAFVEAIKDEKKTNFKIEISSYVDLGNQTDNYKESERRLSVIMDFLVEKGVNHKYISGLYFGDSMPVVDLPPTRFEIELDNIKKK